MHVLSDHRPVLLQFHLSAGIRQLGLNLVETKCHLLVYLLAENAHRYIQTSNVNTRLYDMVNLS